MPEHFSSNASNLLFWLLCKNEKVRLGSRGAMDVKKHNFFKGIEWDKVLRQEYMSPFVPLLQNDSDTSQFDKEFASKIMKESDAHQFIDDVENESNNSYDENANYEPRRG